MAPVHKRCYTFLVQVQSCSCVWQSKWNTKLFVAKSRSFPKYRKAYGRRERGVVKSLQDNARKRSSVWSNKKPIKSLWLCVPSIETSFRQAFSVTRNLSLPLFFGVLEQIENGPVNAANWQFIIIAESYLRTYEAKHTTSSSNSNMSCLHEFTTKTI